MPTEDPKGPQLASKGLKPTSNEGLRPFAVDPIAAHVRHMIVLLRTGKSHDTVETTNGATGLAPSQSNPADLVDVIST